MDFSRITKPSLLYKTFYGYVALALRFIYFRKFRIVGRRNIPSGKKEGFLLICNHQLGLMDALSIIFSVAPREPVFLARGDIFEKPALARLLMSLRIMPAYRKRDVGTEGLDKNDEVFKESVKLMDQGVVIALFPEAGHQSHHYLGTFKKGFARIAFGYEEACGFARDLKILPLGHHYSGYSGIQNDVLFQIGEPFTFADLYDTYKEHPERARYLLTRRARERVEALVLNVEDPDNYEAVELLCQMYVPLYERANGLKKGNLRNDLAAKRELNAILRSVDYGRPAGEGTEAATAAEAPEEAGADGCEDAAAGTPPRQEDDLAKRMLVAGLIQKASGYMENLGVLGLDDDIVARAGTSGFIGRTILWILLLPVFALSAVINFVPHRVSVALSRKIKDKMLVHSLKFGVGLFAFLIWYLILFALIWIFTRKFWIAIVALLLMPATMLAYHHLRVLTKRLVMRLKKYRYAVRRNPLFSATRRLRRNIVSDLDKLSR